MERKRINEEHFEKILISLVEERKFVIANPEQFEDCGLIWELAQEIEAAKKILVRVYTVNLDRQKREWIEDGIMIPELKRAWGK